MALNQEHGEGIRPQLTYSPEGRLRIKTGLDEQVHSKTETQLDRTIERDDQLITIELLSEQPGITVNESAGIFDIDIDVAERFRHRFTPEGEYQIGKFLTRIGAILPFSPDDAIDRVFSADTIGPSGAIGVVNEHFQRWLNRNGVDEDAARHAAKAMAVPYGQDMVQEVEENFRFGGSEGWAEVGDISVSVRKNNFTFYKVEENDKNVVETVGQVEWSHVTLSTLGDCACWGVDSSESEIGVRFGDTSRRLYKMFPHNVDYPRQSLSLLLGAGALAHHAAQYEGREDIVASAAWQQPRVFPKPTAS